MNGEYQVTKLTLLGIQHIEKSSRDKWEKERFHVFTMSTVSFWIQFKCTNNICIHRMFRSSIETVHNEQTKP